MEDTPKEAIDATPGQAENDTENAQRPKRERRPRKNDAEKGNPTDSPQAKQYRPKTAKVESPQQPKYRKKGEKTPDDEEHMSPSPEPKERPQTSQRKQKNPKKNGTGGREQQQKYRVKGEKGQSEEEQDDNEPRKRGDKKKPEEQKESKNLVYLNPMEFKEKRKFKTKWEEYRHGDWRKGSGKTFVTQDTQIPPMPDKKLTLPDEGSFHKRQADIEERIKEITNNLEEKKTQFEVTLKDKNSQMKAGDSGVVYSKELGVLFGQMKKLKEQRQSIYSAQGEVTDGQGDLQGEREYFMKKIDKVYNTEDKIPKGIKEAEKKLATSTGGRKMEEQTIKRIQFLKDSVEFIKKKEVVDKKLNEMNFGKKAASKGLPQIKDQMKKLQEEIEVIKSQQNQKTETKESFDKQLDTINERRKKLRDERDKLYKQKEELRDSYYGGLILYQKQQYLIQDINWMTEMQGKIQQREEEKDRRNKEYQERKDRIAREREERKEREDARKQKEKEKKEREAENKKILEEQLKADEITHLTQIEQKIKDNAQGSNPMFEQIEQCEYLLKFCKKHLKNEPAEEEVAEPEQPGEKKKENKDLDKALQKGSIKLAPSKAEKETFNQIGSKGGKKTKKTNAGQAGQGGKIDFNLIKKFNNLKISAPLDDDDYQRTYDELNDLKNALSYWGKIILRQNKIKFIRNSRKIINDEEYLAEAEKEEKFIENEKSKFEGDDVSEKTNLSLDKLKIAQVIDRENRMKKPWDQEDFDSDVEEDSDEIVYTADDLEGGDSRIADKRADKDRKRNQRGGGGDRGRGGRGGGRGGGDRDDDVVPKGEYYKKPKQSQRPNAQKFSEIMKNTDAFPALDNQFDEENYDQDYANVEEPGNDGDADSRD